jgi:hypothetical protein
MPVGRRVNHDHAKTVGGWRVAYAVSIGMNTVAPAHGRREILLGTLSGASGLVLLAALVVLPFYSTSGTGISSSGIVTSSSGTATLLQESPSVRTLLVVLGFAALSIILGAWLDGRAHWRPGRWLLGAGTVVWCAIVFVGLASIGLFMVPTGVLAVAAALAARRRRPQVSGAW